MGASRTQAAYPCARLHIFLTGVPWGTISMVPYSITPEQARVCAAFIAFMRKSGTNIF